MARLEARGLSKRFGEVVAAQEVSFRVEEGELLALLGPSGCGKTTVLRMLAGLERPDAGTVWLDGRDVTPLPPEARGMGLVFQSYALFPHLTVAGNVAYGLRFARGLSRRERLARVRELLALVGLSGYERRKPHQLSQGERQRVALARALAPRPRVLLLDEPLSALDAALRVQLRGEVRGLLKHIGITAVHVTHDQEEALAIADRVGVMRAGRLEQIDAPEVLYRAPKTPFVATFLGRANLWPGVVVSASTGEVVVEVEGEHIPARGEGAPGCEVYVFFRPEDIVLDEGSHEAEVEKVEFLGDRWEVRARFRGLPLLLYSPRSRRGGERLRFKFSTPPRLLPCPADRL